MNEDLKILAENINNIYIENNELLAISIEFSHIYFKNRQVDEESFDKFWESKALIALMSQATKEAIVLAVSATSLKESVDFYELINETINWGNQVFYINELTKNEEENKILVNFIYSLRREIFSRIFHQNKNFINFSEIPYEVAEQRKDKFMELNTYEV